MSSYMELRLRPGLLFSEHHCCRITVVTGVFVLHVLSSSNIFFFINFSRKAQEQKALQCRGYQYQLGDKERGGQLLLCSHVYFAYVLFDIPGLCPQMCSILFHSHYKGIIIGNAGCALWLT